MPPPPMFEARLLGVRALSPTVRELAFERVDGTPMVFEPGQWVNAFIPVRVGDADQIKRSYSIASPPEGSPRFEIAITRVQGGPGSTWLHSVHPGVVLRFTGPQGFFTRAIGAGPPSLMIATGTGVTPMRSMLRAAVAAGSTAPVRLLLGVRHEEDVLYADEFEAIARRHHFFRFDTTLSQPRGSWQGRRGYVQAHVRDAWQELAAGADETPHAYVCGLQRMVGSVRDLLRKDMGLARDQVHTERYD
jgi:CDP-4-dehydro-6-deoxyglucose reductase